MVYEVDSVQGVAVLLTSGIVMIQTVNSLQPVKWNCKAEYSVAGIWHFSSRVTVDKAF